MADTAQIVTDKIIAILSEGVIPWHRPWCSVTAGAYNEVTGRPYSLLNQLLLGRSGAYATYQEIHKLGGHVRRGEHGQQVVFFKRFEEQSEEESSKDDPTEMKSSADRSGEGPPRKADSSPAGTTKKGAGGKIRRYPVMMRLYTVFHLQSQCEGIQAKPRSIPYPGTARIDRAEDLLGGYLKREGVGLVEDISNEAYYSPAADMIHIPSIGQYKDPGLYYSVLAHEAVHSTGHAKRLARAGVMGARFGEELYSKEELVAEIGAAALMHTAGIGSDLSLRNSAAYIQGWLQALRSDKRLIITAAGQAQKAAWRITMDAESSMAADWHAA